MKSMTLQTVDRALMVLEMVAQRPMTLQEIEKETALNRTTVTRLVTTLLNRGYIEKDINANRYQVGLKVVEIGSIKLNQIELKTEAMPFLRELSSAINQVCHMGILAHGEVVYIEKIEPSGSIRMFSAIGKRVPVHSTSLGKVLVSSLDNAQISSILKEKGMHAFTKHTLRDHTKYMEQIDQTRKQGFAVDDAENEEGIYCVAAPIMDYRNTVIAAISTTGTDRGNVNGTNSKVIEMVKNTALQISRRMGFIV